MIATPVGKSDPFDIMLAERAGQARERGDGAFFEKHAGHAAQYPGFALEYARYLVDKGDREAALCLTEDRTDVPAQWLHAELLRDLGRHDDAIKAARSIKLERQRNLRLWRFLLDILAEQRDIPRIFEIEREWRNAEPHLRYQAQISMFVGHALRVAEDYETALERLLVAIAEPGINALAAIECGNALLALGRPQEALAAMDGFTGGSSWQNRRLRELRAESRQAIGKSG